MGKGDKKTAKGKRFMGSHGNTRPKSTSTPAVATQTNKVKNEAPAEKKAAVKKASAPKATEKKATGTKKATTAKKTTTKKSEA